LRSYNKRWCNRTRRERWQRLWCQGWQTWRQTWPGKNTIWYRRTMFHRATRRECVDGARCEKKWCNQECYWRQYTRSWRSL